MAVDRKYIVNLKQKEFVLWAGLLDAATQAGLVSVHVDLLQHPAPENGQLAIAQATCTFADGRTFTEIGDCGPGNCTPMIAPHAARMAATRAKGRCLRDALNIAETMLEELGPDTEPEPAPPKTTKPPAKPHQPPVQPAATSSAGVDPHCSWRGCKQPLSDPELAASMDFAARPLCPAHLAAAQSLPRCSTAGCKVVLNQPTAEQTQARFGQLLCARHAAEAVETSAAP